MLALRLSPLVNSKIRLSKKGVTALPKTPFLFASACAAVMKLAMRVAGISNSLGIGLHTSMPPCVPNKRRARSNSAMDCASFKRRGMANVLCLDQKAGSTSTPRPMTGTPLVSSTSSVLPRSRIALAPAQTTITGVRDSSSKSAEISKLVSAPICTPPMPPVAKTEMPAKAAPIMVAATVVPAVRFWAMANAKSARETFMAPLVLASASRSASVSPIFKRPSITAIVAGTAPSA